MQAVKTRIALGILALTVLVTLYLFYAWLNVLFPFTPPVPGDIRTALGDESFYFEFGGDIYELRGVQRRPTLRREATCKLYYLHPSKSPTGEFLAYWKVIASPHFVDLCKSLELDDAYGQPGGYAQLVQWNVNTNEEIIIRDHVEVTHPSFDLALWPPAWSQDGKYVSLQPPPVSSSEEFACISGLSHIKEFGGLGPCPSGYQKIEREYDPSFACKFFSDGTKPCFTNSTGRFDFFFHKKEGLFTEFWIEGHDKMTNRYFRLTTSWRSLYSE